MYLNSDTTYVEINTKVPLHWRMPTELLGFCAWDIQLLNKDNLNILRLDPASYTVREVGTFTPICALVGQHPMGTSHLTVDDTSNCSEGMVIRLSDLVFKVISIDSVNHILVIDQAIGAEISDGVVIKKVVNPEFLGRYWVEIVPTMLGRYIVTLTSTELDMTPVEDDIEVITSLAATGPSGKISAISGNTVG